MTAREAFESIPVTPEEDEAFTPDLISQYRGLYPLPKWEPEPFGPDGMEPMP